MSAALRDPEILVTVIGLAVLCLIGYAARRSPSLLLLLALVSVAVSVRYLDIDRPVDPATRESVLAALDTVLKIGLAAAALWYARRNGIVWRRLIPVTSLAVIGLLSFGPAAFHPALTPLQVLRSFLALSTTWLFLAVRRSRKDAERQLALLAYLPLIDVLLGLVLLAVGIHEPVRHEYTGAWRLQGATIPAHLGMLCVVGVAAGMHGWTVGRRVSSLLVAVNLSIAVLTGTRAAIILALVLVMAGVARRARFLLLRVRRVLPYAAAYASGLFVVAYLYLPAMRDRFFGDARERIINTSGRVDAWVFFWNTAQVNPVFGRGLGAATVANRGELPAAFKVPHNEYLRLLVDGGWFGLTIYLLAAAIALRPVVQRGGQEVAVAVGVWAAYCAVDNALSTPQASILFPTLVAALAAGCMSDRPGTPPDIPIVVYITGVSRSGSTLLERALNRLPGVVSVGELVHLWSRGVRANEPCSCGAPFASCPFWTAVGRRLGEGWSHEQVDLMLRLQRRVGRHRMLLLLGSHLPLGRRGRDIDAYCRALGAVYAAVAAEAGARIVVDASKLPITAHLLARSGLVDLRVLHLVRDSRAYAHSAAKRVPRPEAPGELMRRAGPVRCSLEWIGFHLASEGLRGSSSRYVRLSYERFASGPAAALDDLAWLFDRVGHRDIVDARNGTVLLELDPWHSVSGNPLRFRSGMVVIQPDNAWRTQLARLPRLIVTTLTAPGLLSYGYLLRADGKGPQTRSRSAPMPSGRTVPRAEGEGRE